MQRCLSQLVGFLLTPWRLQAETSIKRLGGNCIHSVKFYHATGVPFWTASLPGYPTGLIMQRTTLLATSSICIGTEQPGMQDINPVVILWYIYRY
jgi:hypothetical protein